MFNHSLVAMIVTVVLACSMPAAAGDLLLDVERPSWSRAAAPPVNPSDPYAGGSWNVQVYGGAIPHFQRSVSVAFGAVALEYYLWDNMALVGELAGYHQYKGPVDTSGAGFSLLPRWHFWHFDEPRISLYAEGGAGVVGTADRFIDTNGTKFNFSLHLGLGAKWRLTDNIFLIGGPRYTHFSNARIKGKGRNPGFDGIGGYGGIQINF